MAIILWVTVPYFCLTGVRVYGSPAEFKHWRERLILSPIILVLLAFLLLKFAVLTLVLLITLWDHQHSFMQQHGFARIYDYKARAGARSTKNFDLAFNWVFFVNMLAVSPLFTNIWVRMLHEWRLPVDAAMVHQVCWTITILYGLVYVGHVIWCIRRGYTINPLKYLFLFASYFLWYSGTTPALPALPDRFRRRPPHHARRTVHRHHLLLQPHPAPAARGGPGRLCPDHARALSRRRPGQRADGPGPGRKRASPRSAPTPGKSPPDRTAEPGTALSFTPACSSTWTKIRRRYASSSMS